MKFIDRIIADISFCDIEKTESKYHNECKYLADSRVILDNLREYEVEIPIEYFEKYKQVFGNGVLQYMETLTNKSKDEFYGGNTYNWCGKILHDFNYRYWQVDKDTFYVAIQVHRVGDIRYNYTEFALFKFGSFEEFVEIIDDICSEQMVGEFEYNGKHYHYYISIFCEWLRVWCVETEEDYEFYAYDDESFIEEIKKYEQES